MAFQHAEVDGEFEDDGYPDDLPFPKSWSSQPEIDVLLLLSVARGGFGNFAMKLAVRVDTHALSVERSPANRMTHFYFTE